MPGLKGVIVAAAACLLTLAGDAALAGQCGNNAGGFSRWLDQFKREAVELVRVSGRPVGQIAEELGVSDQTLRNWVHADAGGQGKGSLSPDEKEELKLLRKENKRLRMEREILKKAATFFAQENDPK